MVSSSIPRLEVGETVGRYRIEGSLGRGGMAEVYRALDPRLSRPVALKRLRTDTPAHLEQRARFHREARALARLSHPAVARIFDLLEIPGDSPEEWLVMELVEGMRLKDLVDKGPLDPGLVLFLGLEICSGLGAAHKLGIIHRDLKSENIVVDGEGKPKILDFGLAHGAEPLEADPEKARKLTRLGQLVGTPRCMAPEHVQGLESDLRVDLFALGVLIYEMSTGVSPFAAPSPLETVSNILKKDPIPVGDRIEGLPPELDAVVTKCLEKDPSRRYRSTEEVLRELRTAAFSLAKTRPGEGPGVVPMFLPSVPVGPRSDGGEESWWDRFKRRWGHRDGSR